MSLVEVEIVIADFSECAGNSERGGQCTEQVKRKYIGTDTYRGRGRGGEGRERKGERGMGEYAEAHTEDEISFGQSRELGRVLAGDGGPGGLGSERTFGQVRLKAGRCPVCSQEAPQALIS